MYQSSSSSSSPSSSTTKLTRYCSAPGSLLTKAVDSVIGPNRDSFLPFEAKPNTENHHQHHYFSSVDSSDSTCKAAPTTSFTDPKEAPKFDGGGLQRSYGFNDVLGGGSLVRQRSSPAGFLSHVAAADNGFSVRRGGGSYNHPQGGSNGGYGESRLKPQLSFTTQDSLSHISEEGSEDVVVNGDNGQNQSFRHSYGTNGFGFDSWDNSSNSIVFSSPGSKRSKNNDGEYFTSYNVLESQFSLPQTTLEMATVEKLLHVNEDSVPCKIRAKRGCATHPRSIAERERRTRISGKLKKLQDLVPNMDKQTSYADMLDLAVEHIKGLQVQVQKLEQDLEGCTCGCKCH